MKYVLGMDIGYSNLKLAMGFSGDTPKEVLLPAGAAPASQMLTDFSAIIDGASQSKAQSFVNVNGEEWVAGISMVQLEGVERELHADYPSTDKYKALFYASLLQTGMDHIDVLVTGLPVDQYRDFELRERLVENLKGVNGGHRVNESKFITIGEVAVLPQPFGAYMNLLSSTNDLELMEEGLVVSLDPGYFSFDWVAMLGRALKKNSSGSSTQAMSKVLEKAAELINEMHDTSSCSKDQLEDAIRRGREYIFVDGNRVIIEPVMNEAGDIVAPIAMTKFKQSMRDDSRNPDIVLIAGGGSKFYEKSAREAFPKSKVVVPQNPTMANARGYYFYGE